RGIFFGVGLELRVPRPLQVLAALDASAEIRQRIVGNEEWRLGGISVEFLGQLYLFDAERIAVRGRGPLLTRAAVADGRADPNQRRPAALRDSIFDRRGQRREIVRILDDLRMPFVSVESFAHVLVKAELRVPVD